MLNFFKNLSPVELIILVSIVVVLFGAKALKSLAKTAGQSYKEIRNVKKSFNEAMDDKSDKAKEKQS